MSCLFDFRLSKGDQYKTNTLVHFNYGYDSNEAEQNTKTGGNFLAQTSTLRTCRPLQQTQFLTKSTRKRQLYECSGD